jgi:hypothetical protein
MYVENARGSGAGTVEFTAYYDASGKQSDKHGALVVVGLVATNRKWERFEREWNAMLVRHNVSYFHMHEFAHSSGPFASWKGREDKRSQLIREMVQTIKRGINKGFSFGMFMSDYHKVNKEYQLAESYGAGKSDRGAFALCASTCVWAVHRWFNIKYPHAQVQHIYEAGDEGRTAFEAFTAKGVPSFRTASFLPKVRPDTGERVRQFEAADFIAWEHRKFYMIATDNQPNRLRKSFAEVDAKLPMEWRYQHADSLRRICEGDVPRRATE